jgi:phosphatidylinositol alpha-1,6-mannosyltransferase
MRDEQVTALLLSLTFPPQTGGSGRWFWEIYRRLPRERVRVVAGECPGAAEFDEGHDLAIRRMPLAFESFGILGPAKMRRYLRTAWALRRLVAMEGVQAVHCGCCLPEGLLGWLLKRMTGVPYLCYVHGEELNFPSRELAWLRRRVFRGAKMVIANSRNTWRLLRDQWNVPEAKLRLMHPGVDVERFLPARCVPRLEPGNEEREERSRLGWQNRLVVLTVGRLQKRKGHDMLIRALPAIRPTVPDVLYSIVGDGDERDSLHRLVAELGLHDHVQFRGETSDDELIRCYQQCDLFVLPNRDVNGDFEGFGMVLLEAQACGKAVVAGASGGTAETMSIGQTGHVVACDRPEELAALVIRLLLDEPLRAKMGEAARRWAVERFSWDSLSRQAHELFFGEPASASAPAAQETCPARTAELVG